MRCDICGKKGCAYPPSGQNLWQRQVSAGDRKYPSGEQSALREELPDSRDFLIEIGTHEEVY